MIVRLLVPGRRALLCWLHCCARYTFYPGGIEARVGHDALCGHHEINDRSGRLRLTTSSSASSLVRRIRQRSYSNLLFVDISASPVCCNGLVGRIDAFGCALRHNGSDSAFKQAGYHCGVYISFHGADAHVALLAAVLPVNRIRKSSENFTNLAREPVHRCFRSHPG